MTIGGFSMQKYTRKLVEARHDINSIELLYLGESGDYESEKLMIALPHLVVTAYDFDNKVCRYEKLAGAGLIPELFIVPYEKDIPSPMYQLELAGAKKAMCFYRDDDIDIILRKTKTLRPKRRKIPKDLIIVDFALYSHQLVLFLGNPKIKDYHGDDWDDSPYDCNAGTVYSEYYEDMVILNFDENYEIIEPTYGYLNTPYCKEDMRDQGVPCILYQNKNMLNGYRPYNFGTAWKSKKYHEIHMGDKISKVVKEAGVLVSDIKSITGELELPKENW